MSKHEHTYALQFHPRWAEKTKHITRLWENQATCKKKRGWYLATFSSVTICGNHGFCGNSTCSNVDSRRPRAFGGRLAGLVEAPRPGAPHGRRRLRPAPDPPELPRLSARRAARGGQPFARRAPRGSPRPGASGRERNSLCLFWLQVRTDFSNFLESNMFF